MKAVIIFFLTFLFYFNYAQINIHSTSFIGKEDSIKYQIALNCKEMFKTEDYNKYFISEDLQKWGNKIGDYIRIFPKYKSESKYRFSIQGIEKIDKDKYEVTVSITENIDSLNNFVISIYSFYSIKDNSNKYKFSLKLNDILDEWYKIKIGNIVFYKQDSSTFNREEAIKMNSDNIKFSEIFKTKPIDSIFYFSFQNTDEMFQTMGFNYIQNIHYSKTGALPYIGKNFKRIIFAGNGKEIYSHELVHYYLDKMAVDTTINYSRFTVEGICTFLGGSNDMALDSHLIKLRNLIKMGYDFDLKSNIQSKEIKYGDNGISSNLYVIGGYFAKKIYEKKKLNGIISYLNTDSENLLAKIMQLLEKNFKQLEFDFYKDIDSL